MILLLTNLDDAHADFVCTALRRKGAEFHRLHTENLPRTLKVTLAPEVDAKGVEAGRLRDETGALALTSVSSIWFRRPRAPALRAADDPTGIARRQSASALTALHLGLRDRFWVNPPWRQTALANDKLLQLDVARQCGLRTPATLITNDSKEAVDFFRTKAGRVIYKPYALAGDVFGNAFIFTSEVSERHFEEPARFRSAPVVLQEAIPKKVELRVTVIGRRVFASEIDSSALPESRVDWRRGIPRGLPERTCSLPQTVERACLALTAELGLVFGAIDLIRTPGDDYVFLEINPAGQWLWVEMKTGLPLLDAFCEMLIQARADYEIPGSGPAVTYEEIARDPALAPDASRADGKCHAPP